MSSNETKFIFAQEGLPELRRELRKTVQEVEKSQKKLNSTRASGETRRTAGSGKDAAAAKQAYKTMEEALGRYSAALDENIAKQKQLKAVRADQEKRGVRPDRSLRDKSGRFTGETQASLEAQQLRIVQNLRAEYAKNVGVANNALTATNALLDKQILSEKYLAEQRAESERRALRDRTAGPKRLGGGGFGTVEAETAHIEDLKNRANETVTVLDSLRQRLRDARNIQKGLGRTADSELTNKDDIPVLQKQIQLLERRRKTMQTYFRNLSELKARYEETAQAIRVFDDQQRGRNPQRKVMLEDKEGNTRELTRAQAVNELEKQRSALIHYTNQARVVANREEEKLGVTAENSLEKVIRMRTELASGVNVPQRLQQFATGEFDSFVQNRISQLEGVVTKTTEAMSQVRQQVARQYPEAVSKGSFDAFDRAEKKLARVQERIAENDARIEAMRKSSTTARDAVTRSAFGLPAGKGPTSDQEKRDAEEINGLLTQRRLLRNQELDTLGEMEAATAQIGGIQKGQNLGLRDINTLLQMQREAITEIVNLEGSGFMETFQSAVPGLKEEFDQLTIAVRNFEQAVGEAGGGATLSKIKELEARLGRQKFAERTATTPAAREDARVGPGGSLQLAKELEQAKGELVETLLNKPEAQQAANEVFDVINSMRQKLVTAAKNDPVRVVPPTRELIGQLSVVDRMLLDTFSGMKRRFLTTFQFMFSGAIIFGIQRIVREFVQSAVEVERAFKDISTALHFDIPQQENLASKLFGDFNFTRSLENVRRQVLYIANDLNVLPADANEAAFQMVSRFGDVESAMIATEAQLLATKVATISQSEVLRALTAVGDTFAQNLEDEGSQMERNTKHAKLYMQALDGATILQQKFGIAIEDTLEGAGQLGEVFRQLGFDINETEAAVALVSQRTGQEGSATADRLARSIGNINNVRTELLKLAKADPSLQLSYEDFLGDDGGANVIRKLESQMGTMSKATANTVRELIGGRREAAFVAAFFGTSAERANAVKEMERDTGAARARYDLLTQTVAEAVSGVVSQFQSLAQNLSTVGFLTPMKVLLSILEQVLSVVNRVIQSVSSLVLAFNRVKLPFTKLGLGDMLVTMVSLSLAAQTFGNSFARIALLISTLTKENRIAELLRIPFIGAGLNGLQQAVPKQSLSKFASVAVGASATAPITTRAFSGLSAEKAIIGTARGPLAAATMGIKGFKNGLIQLVASMRMARSAALLDASAEAASATAKEAAAAAATTTAGTADAYKIYSAEAGGAAAATGKMSGGLLGMAKMMGYATAAIIAAMAAWDIVRGVFSESPNFWGDSTVDETLRKRREEAARRTGEGLPAEIKRLQLSSSERSVEAKNDLDLLNAQYTEQQSLFEGLLGFVRDNWARESIYAHNFLARTAGRDTLDRKDFQFLAEGNRFSVAQDIQHQYRGILESKINDLTAQIESDSVSAADKVDLTRLRRELYKRIDKTVDVNSDEFKKHWEDLVSDARDQVYEGWQGDLAGFWTFGILGADPGGNKDISEIALRKLEEEVAKKQDALLLGIGDRLEGLETVRELLDQKGYEDLLGKIKNRFKAGTINRKQQTQEFAEAYTDAQIGLEAALTPRSDGTIANVDEAKKWEDTVQKIKADYIESIFGFADDLYSTGFTITDLYQELQAGEAVLANAIDTRIKTGLGSPRAEEELRRANKDLRDKIYDQRVETAYKFISVGMLQYAKDARKQYEYLKEKQKVIYGEWSNFTSAPNISITAINPNWASAPDLLEILEKYLQNEQAMWDAKRDGNIQIQEMANRVGVLRGDQLVIIQAQITGLKQTIVELKKRGKDAEAFELEKQVADLERQRTQEIIRRNQIRIEAQVVQGDQLSASRASVEVARQTVAALRKANVIEEEKIAAETALKNAEWDYFQTVLHYSDLLRRKGTDVTNPVIQARLDAEAAAEEYANAVGEIEKLEAGQNLAQANAADQRAFYDDRQSELQWLYDSDQIGKSAYIAALRRLQSGVDRSTYQGEQIWRDIERTIMGLADEMEQGFNIPAEIRMPTLFEVRRAVQADAMGVNYQDNRQQDINVYVSDEVDLDAVVEALGIRDGREAARNPAGEAGVTSVFYG